MEVAQTTGASLHHQVNWHTIKWKQVHGTVRRLQKRIVKEYQKGRKRKARALQYILIHSFSGKAMAVKRVTQNQGKATAGVDRVVWEKAEQKAAAITQLRHKGYQPKALKRIFISKNNGGQRPLSIPVMADRAQQALHLLALDPIAETTADHNSYGFRKERSTADAIDQCYCALAKTSSAQWIMEADIRACFDEISHQWLLANIPMDKAVLKKWLKAGYLYQGAWHQTDNGTPQGAIISPALMNMTLDGLEKALKERFAPSEKIGRRNQVNFARYCDDFIITGRNKQLLEQEVKTLVADFLKPRGLELSPTKTKITHISTGFDFLGKNIRKYKGKLLIKPSTKNVKAIKQTIRQTIKENLHASVADLIEKLNPIIKGWANYHRHTVSKHSFKQIDTVVFQSLWWSAKRRHPTKSKPWIKKKYFSTNGTRTWVFQITRPDNNGKLRTQRLVKAVDVKIKRHIKIRSQANPYDPQWEVYFERRLGLQMLDNLKERRKLLRLWFDQEGICCICSQKITKESGWHIHHIIRRTDGGKHTMDNLILLHPICHTQVHCQGLEVVKPRPVKRAS